MPVTSSGLWTDIREKANVGWYRSSASSPQRWGGDSPREVVLLLLDRIEELETAADDLLHDFGNVWESVSFLALPEQYPMRMNQIADAMNAFERAVQR